MTLNTALPNTFPRVYLRNWKWIITQVTHKHLNNLKSDRKGDEKVAQVCLSWECLGAC